MIYYRGNADDRDIAGGPLSRGERNGVSAHVDKVPRAPRREADIGAGWSRALGLGTWNDSLRMDRGSIFSKL